MKYWIPCQPAERNTRAMMRFILATSQQVKIYTAKRIEAGDRKNSTKPVDVLMKEWLGEYLKQARQAEDAPRYALQDAIGEVLRNGVGTWPDQRVDWEAFSVEARGGWKKEKKKKEEALVSWEDYLEGKAKKEIKEGDKRTVVPDQAVKDLLEKGILRFKWGTVQLEGNYASRLAVQAASKGIAPEDFLRRVSTIDFVKVSVKDEWKANFVLE